MSIEGHALFEYVINETKHLDGEIWECGVFEGDTSIVLKKFIEQISPGKILRMFDTFEGMPFSGVHDVHEIGSMKGRGLEFVISRIGGSISGIGNVLIHKGIMPDSFAGLEDRKISVAFIDVDNYDSVKGCIEFIYPRVQSGGWIIIDDYNCPNCPGARFAIDTYMKDKPEKLPEIDNPQNPRIYFQKL